LRLQGEAQMLDSPDPDTTSPETIPPRAPERLLIKKLGREFLIQTRDIEYAEAAGNYVNLHIGKRTYPLRQTMKNLAETLHTLGFKRVHRSYLVNEHLIQEIQPLESGDAVLTLSTQKQIPVSRTYRSGLAEISVDLTTVQ